MVETITWQNVGRNQQWPFVGLAGRDIYRVSIPNGQIWEIYCIQAINRSRETGWCALFVRDQGSSAWHTHLKNGQMENYAGDCTMIWNGRVRARHDVNAEISNVTASDDIQIRLNYRMGLLRG